MNKFKDWFYNFSDVFVCVLITIAASLVIIGNVSNIMSFSDTFSFVSAKDNDSGGAVIHSSSSEGINVVTGNDDTLSSGALASGQPTGGAVSPTTGSITTPTVPKNISSQNTSTGGVSSSANGLRKRISIDIPSGATGSKVAQILKDQGLITDTNDFLSVLSASKLDSKLRSGTFSIPEGSNVTEIINILTGR